VFELQSNEGATTFACADGRRLRVVFVSPSIVRISFTQGRDFSDLPSRIVTRRDAMLEPFDLRVSEESYFLSTASLAVEMSRRGGALTYRDGAGRLLFCEPERGGKWLTPKPVYRNVFNRDAPIAFDLNIDGARAVVAPDHSVLDREAFEAKLEFVFSEGEMLFGLGSHEEGYGNLRGKARELYQQNLKAVIPEPHQRIAINTQQAKLYLDAADINVYSLQHSQSIYEGQRAATAAKRVLNLTRSSYAGQHRYGTVSWNGDVCATWETLRRCIPEGLNFCAAGEPYWTVDIGGFFVNYDPDLWFWRGNYTDGCRGLTGMNAMEPDPGDEGCKDLGYWELFTRWVQYGAFLPMFRVHGTDAAREIWRFGDPGSPFYDAIERFILLRYRLLPYLYSLMAAVTRAGVMMMRALALEFPGDVSTHCILDEFMLGPALLVCPVTMPMYYRAGSVPVTDTAKTRTAYLPHGCAWFDFWTNARHPGGTTVLADAPLDTMPLYARTGSIVPMTDAMQFVDEIPHAPYQIRVYCGADAEFTLYEDAGDGYEYEKGAFALIRMTWKEEAGEFCMMEREGGFRSMVEERDCRVELICERGVEVREGRYVGKTFRLKANKS
jgi:hypothetical protein